MRKVVLALIALTGAQLAAAPWALVTNHFDDTISVIDLGEAPPKVYGPFLAGSLGASGQHLEAPVISPDGSYALITNAQSQSVYKVSLADPTSPVRSGLLKTSFNPQAIAISPDGSFALVSHDGSGLMAIIDLASFTLKATYSIRSSSTAGTCVKIAPDSQTVVVCDLNGNGIIYGVMNPARTGLVSEEALSTGSGAGPNNAAFSPDGSTLLTANRGSAGNATTVSAFALAAPGQLTAGSVVHGLPGWSQSIIFSPDGARAFANTTATEPDKLSWIEVTGPGVAVLGGAGVAALKSHDSNGLFGVDTLAVTPDGTTILAGNPSPTTGPPASFQGISLVDAQSFTVTSLPINAKYPSGIAIFSGSTSPVRPIPAGDLADVGGRRRPK